MNTPESPEQQYTSSFAGEAASENSRAAKALAVALDVRKFEIELYWKRATYFWAFTGVSLAAYLAALTGKNVESRPQALLLTTCVGLVFAVAWYFVNRASKFWQLNWEVHVDLLENAVMGPTYKTVYTGPSPWWKPHGPYPFSVTKINQLLSLFVVAIFALLVGNTLRENYTLAPRNWSFFPTTCVSLTILCLALLVWLGRAGKPHAKVGVQLRTTEVNEYKNDG